MSKDPLQSFLSYINDVKPFHTKIYEVAMSYSHAESTLLARVIDKLHITVTLYNYPGGGESGGNGGGTVEICDGVGWDTLPFDSELWDYPYSCISKDPRRVAVTLNEGYRFTITMVHNDDTFSLVSDNAYGWDVPRWDFSVWDPNIRPLFTSTDVVDEPSQTTITETIKFTVTEV